MPILALVDGAAVQVAVQEQTLVLGEERYPFESIYSSRLEQGTLSIHLCYKIVNDKDTATPTEESTIANFRKAPGEWARKSIALKQLDEALDQVAAHLPGQAPQRQRLSVMINPAAGGRKAVSHWEDIVKPMLLHAGYQPSDLSVTLTTAGQTRALAKEIGKTALESDTVPPIICLGGDGTIHEVINGLQDAALGNAWSRPPAFQIGIIPSGSGNAFSLSLGIESIEHAALRIIRGNKASFHLFDARIGRVTGTPWQHHIEYPTQPRTRLLVVASWGFHAQLVSKARYLQPFMGNSRFSWVAYFLLLFLQQHRGEVILKDAQRYSGTDQQFGDPSTITLDGEFTYFLVSKQSSLERGFMVAPFASPNTRDMDVVVLRGATRDQLKEVTVKVIQGGRHVEDVEYYKVPELLLRVEQPGEICLDGEIHDLPAGGVLHLKIVDPSPTEPSFQVYT